MVILLNVLRFVLIFVVIALELLISTEILFDLIKLFYKKMQMILLKTRPHMRLLI